MKLTLALCALSLLASVASCDPETACTAMECDPALTLVLEGAGGEPLPQGTYEIALVVDGQPDALVCGHDGVGWLCEDPEVESDFELRVHADDDAIVIEFTGHDDGDTVGPTSVDIEVVSGDAPLVDTRITPDYETSEPNGEGCGRCDVADVAPIQIDVTM